MSEDPEARRIASEALSYVQTALASLAGAGDSVVAAYAPPALFTAIGAWASPAAVASFTTSGHSTPGIGGGRYVADLLATSALASASPEFCAVDHTGRYWRLAADDARVAVSQGGALGGWVNDQPAVQAAIDYAKAIGARTLLFDFDQLALWCPARTSSASDGEQIAFNLDGQSMVVSAPIRFLGLGTRTHILLLSTLGTSLETGWQNIGGSIWRGSGINLMGGPSAASPNAYGLTDFTLENIWLDGGCDYTGVRGDPTPSSPDGADLSNKGIRLQNTQLDMIVLRNSKINGFKGEAYYLAGSTQTLQILDDSDISGSNQSAFNPSTGVVLANNCNFGGSFISVECLGGIGGRYNNCRFYDSVQTGITGGPANGLLYDYAYPTRELDKAPPWIDLVDCDFHNAGQLIIGNYVRITGRATDISITLDTAITNGSLTSTYIKLKYTLDQETVSPICVLQGPPTLTTEIPNDTSGNFIQPISDVHVELDIHRTANAIANARYAIGYSVAGFIDQNSCSLHIGQADGVVQMVIPIGNSALPLVTMDGPSSSHMIGSGRPLAEAVLPITSGPYAVVVSNPRHSLAYGGAATAIAITMEAPFSAPFGYAFGQRTRIYFDGGTTSGTTYTFARNGTGLRLNSDCVLAVFGDWIELEFNADTGLWHEDRRSIHAA